MFKKYKNICHYDQINMDLKPFISVKEKDFNKLEKDIRDTIVECAIYKKQNYDRNNEKIKFENIPEEITKIIVDLGINKDIFKDIFESLDVFPQQLIINYSYKYNEKKIIKKNKTNLIYELEKKIDINDITKSNIVGNKFDEWFCKWLNSSVLINDEIKTNKIRQYIDNIKNLLYLYNKRITNLKNNIKYNKHKYNSDDIKKDKSYYEKKITKYENALNHNELFYIALKKIYIILDNIIYLNDINKQL